jgi:hypothetical protein
MEDCRGSQHRDRDASYLGTAHSRGGRVPRLDRARVERIIEPTPGSNRGPFRRSGLAERILTPGQPPLIISAQME